MSQSTQNDSPPTPSRDFELDLDAHGFELDAEAPRQVEGSVTRQSQSTYLLEFTVDDAYWRIELAVDQTGNLEPLHAFHEGALVASNGHGSAREFSAAPEWLQFVVQYVTEEVV